MSNKRRGLGRGLDALLGPAVEATTAVDTDSSAKGDLRNLPIDLLQRGRFQPRQDMVKETLDELADSIRAQGVVQPIVVRALPGGEETRYEIIAGERRWRAAQMAGLDEVPAVVRQVADDAAIAMALIENIQRENLNPLEEAQALKRLIDEFNVTHEEAAKAVGRSRASVSNLLRLLDLELEVKNLVAARKLEMGHARALLGLSGATQVQAARQVESLGMSVRATEQLVKKLSGSPLPKPKTKVDPDVERLENQLGERLGAKVKIQTQSGGKGQLVIHYNSLDELDGIMDHIK
ncbi:MAG: ParB/RepB/Spo0J family partition protein [Pseudomonadota bacterium]